METNYLKKSIEFTKNIVGSKVSKIVPLPFKLKSKVTEFEVNVIYMNDHKENTKNIHNNSWD